MLYMWLTECGFLPFHLLKYLADLRETLYELYAIEVHLNALHFNFPQ